MFVLKHRPLGTYQFNLIKDIVMQNSFVYNFIVLYYAVVQLMIKYYTIYYSKEIYTSKAIVRNRYL